MKPSSCRHVIFFDGECAVCNRLVKCILQRDKKEIFLFAPLQGITAKKAGKIATKKWNNDTLVLLENYQTPQEKTLTHSQAAFRICYHLGGGWAILGILSFMPSFVFDWGYSLFAKNRKSFFSQDQECFLFKDWMKKRFLP